VGFPFGGAPQQQPEPQSVKRGDTLGAARAGLDVPRVTFALWLVAHGKLGRGDLVADRREVRRGHAAD
jgi:predicted thioredoxin/glutaredoxin